MKISLESALLKLSGLLVMAIGIAHFFMPVFGYDAKDLAEVPYVQRNHFVNLGAYMIGSFLVSFAVMTFMVDIRKPNVKVLVFLGLMVFVWAWRVVLELIFPANLPLFLLTNDHIGLMVVLPIIWIGYLVAFVQTFRLSRQAV